VIAVLRYEDARLAAVIATEEHDGLLIFHDQDCREHQFVQFGERLADDPGGESCACGSAFDEAWCELAPRKREPGDQCGAGLRAFMVTRHCNETAEQRIEARLDFRLIIRWIGLLRYDCCFGLAIHVVAFGVWSRRTGNG